MRVNEKILKAATEKVQLEKDFGNYIKVCFEARLCPSCGGNLKTEAIGTAHPPLISFSCSSCGFSHKTGERVKLDIEPEPKGKSKEGPIILNSVDSLDKAKIQDSTAGTKLNLNSKKELKKEETIEEKEYKYEGKGE